MLNSYKTDQNKEVLKENNHDIAVEIENVCKSFGTIDVIKDASLKIKKGEIYGIIGHSGAGKSTLLRCINGLEVYNSGNVKVMGKEIADLTDEQLRKFRKNLGMIFQNFNLLKRKTVFENVAFPLKLWGYPYEDEKISIMSFKKRSHSKQAINKRVTELLKLVGLEDKKFCKPAELSGGQKQRVAIARALALDPEILLCDEATSALDPKTTKDILNLLLRINKELGITVIMVTHQMEVIKEVCERVALLDGGKIEAEGSTEDLFLKPSRALKKFLGEEDNDTLPKSGVNIKIFFPSTSSENALITKMSRELNIDFSIVWGRLEKFRENILGGLVINIDESNKKEVLEYLRAKDVLLEVIE